MKIYTLFDYAKRGFYSFDSYDSVRREMSKFPNSILSSFSSVERERVWKNNVMKTLYRRDPIELSQRYGLFFDSGQGRYFPQPFSEVSLLDSNNRNQLPKIIDSNYLNPFGNLVLEDSTNNIGELMGFILACKISLISETKIDFIAGDSKLVFFYWSLGDYSNRMKEKENLILLATSLREKSQAKGIEFILISGDRNPADCGFHIKRSLL